MAPSEEVNKMHGTNTRIRAVDVELIETLTAISVVSKRLARKLMILESREPQRIYKHRIWKAARC